LMIRKDDTTDDFQLACQYQITTTISVCPPGQVAISEGPPTCVPVNTISANGTIFGIPATTTGLIIYAVNFATDQNVVNVTVESPDFDTLSGQSGYAINFDDNNFCFASENGNGQIFMTCNSVPAGPFYIVVDADGSATNPATISVVSSVCGAAFSGFNCGSPLYNFSSSPSFTGTIAPSTGTFFNQAIFFIDFAVNSSVSLNITVTNTAGDGVLVVRKGSFPYDDSLDGTGGPGEIFDEVTDLPSALFFEPVDSYIGGRYYFSVVNTDDTVALSYIVTSNGASTTSPTIGTASAATASATAATATSATATVTSGATTTGTHPSTSTGATVTSTGATVTGATVTGATGTTTTAATTVSTAATATTTAKATTGSANALVVPIFFLASLILALL